MRSPSTATIEQPQLSITREKPLCSNKDLVQPKLNNESSSAHDAAGEAMHVLTQPEVTREETAMGQVTWSEAPNKHVAEPRFKAGNVVPESMIIGLFCLQQIPSLPTFLLPFLPLFA